MCHTVRTVALAKISSEKKIEIKALLQVGLSQRYIGKTLNVSKTCVWSVTKKIYLFSNSRGQGRKKASTTIDDRNITFMQTRSNEN